MVTSLLDRHGLRHEIDLETWVSSCFQWVVRETHGDCTGIAEHHCEVQTAVPVWVLGSAQRHWVAGRDRVKDEEATFTDSEEPITCLQCIANAIGR